MKGTWTTDSGGGGVVAGIVALIVVIVAARAAVSAVEAIPAYVWVLAGAVVVATAAGIVAVAVHVWRRDTTGAGWAVEEHQAQPEPLRAVSERPAVQALPPVQHVTTHHHWYTMRPEDVAAILARHHDGN